MSQHEPTQANELRELDQPLAVADGTAPRAGPPCCSPAAQLECCEPADKAACCGAARSGSSCGCRV